MTFYEVLEIDPRASTAEIERAFRQLARKVHPDLNSGDPRGAEARMKLLNEIRDTLTEPLRRAVYDAELLHEAASRAHVPSAAASEPAGPAVHDGTSSGRTGASSSWVKRAWLAIGVGTLSAAVFIAAHPERYETTSPEDPPSPTRDADASAAPALLATPTTPSARPTAPSSPLRGRPSGRGVVRIGTRADDVLRKLGTPDRVEPGAHSGDATFVYGKLRLEVRNGRVAGGNAAE